MMKICPSCKTDFPGGEVFCPNDGARLVTASQWDTPSVGDDPMVGTILQERYRILRRIGEGGMGLVYEAEHVTIEKRVALKILRDDFSSRPEVVERFRQEARSASKIGNDHIVDISDFGITPSGASYFVMELLTGEDLANVLEREETIPLERAVDILLQCCKALGAAHAKGIVHRDMKPENIFLTEKAGRTDFVKIVDFGIAKMSDIETPGAPGRKLTKTGMIFGTPEYMSPEQAAGKELDHRVDIYAMAVILFEMLTGRVPFVGDTFMGILTQHMFEDPPGLFDVNPKADAPDAVVAFIYRGLAKDAGQRYQSCDEMGAALREAMGALGGAVPASTSYAEYAAPQGRSSQNTARVAVQQDAVRSPEGRGFALKAAMVLLGAVFAAAVVGGGVVWALGGGDGLDVGDGIEPRPFVDALPPPLTDAGTAIAAPVVADAGAAVADVIAEGADVDAGPPMVTVSVNTSPSGAQVFVEGRGPVCDATPCGFETEAGQSITVRARRGRSDGETELTPGENTTIQLAMRRRPRPNGRNPGGEQGTQGGGGDLKIPDIFRNR